MTNATIMNKLHFMRNAVRKQVAYIEKNCSTVKKLYTAAAQEGNEFWDEDGNLRHKDSNHILSTSQGKKK